MKEKKERPTIDEMWEFIDNIMKQHRLVPNRSILDYDEVYPIYSKLAQIDRMFRDLEHVSMLKGILKKHKQETSSG